MVVGYIEEFENTTAEIRYRASEFVVLEGQVEEPGAGGSEGGGNVTCELVVGQIKFLEINHTLEGIIGDLTREVIIGQVQ